MILKSTVNNLQHKTGVALEVHFIKSSDLAFFVLASHDQRVVTFCEEEACQEETNESENTCKQNNNIDYIQSEQVMLSNLICFS